MGGGGIGWCCWSTSWESGNIGSGSRMATKISYVRPLFLSRSLSPARFPEPSRVSSGYAFLLLRKRWAVPSHSITPASWKNPLEVGEGNKERFAGHTMLQLGLGSELWDASDEERRRGKVLFVHANLIKRITGYARIFESVLPFNESATDRMSLRVQGVQSRIYLG